MYVRGVHPYWEDRHDTRKAKTSRNEGDYIPKQQIGSGIKDEDNQSIEGVSFGCCPNKERVRIMQASLGKLCRNDCLDSTPWTKIPQKPCKFILQTIMMANQSIKPPCHRCKWVAKMMKCWGFSTIRVIH